MADLHLSPEAALSSIRRDLIGAQQSAAPLSRTLDRARQTASGLYLADEEGDTDG